MHATLDPERVGDALLARLAEWLPASRWAVVIADGESALRRVAARDLSSIAEVAADALAREVIRTAQPCATADTAADRRFNVAPGVAAYGFPLTCRGRAFAAVVGLDDVPAGHEPQISACAAALAGPLEMAALALDNAFRIQRAEELSVTDDLTTLYNGRYLAQALRREVKRASRSGRPLSLLFIDLDGFKSINDTHGHLFGSRALVEAAEVIRGSARETDVGARYGGDEFALVLPDTPSEGAIAVGERVRERIAAHPFLQSAGLNIHLTASVGIATLSDVANSMESLIDSADKAMYWVKDHGKNGIRVAGTGRTAD